jgi:uncharacterized membrane protein YgdD (TMEM256/DUF423 family)
MTATDMTATKLHLVIACLFGVLGIALLAAATHATGAKTTEIAGQMLLFHAPALIAVTAARKAGLLHDTVARIALLVLITGIVLFAGDLALRGLATVRLFPMASPIGGFAMMGGWIGLGVAAILAKRI